MRNPTLPLVLALSSLLVACSGAGESPEAEALGRQASAVQGGQVDTDRANNFVVGIASRFGGVCTGTLIAPNLVLTARHCVVPPDGHAAVTCADRFSDPVPVSALGITTSPNLFRARGFHQASEIIVPKDDGFCGNDIALIILEDNVPASEAKPATPVVQFKMTDDDQIGPRITAMGYGLTSPSANDSGQRRIRENINILCVPGSKWLTCEGQLAQLVDSDAEFVTEGFVCSGDSGSGAFDQKTYDAGKPYVLGTLSRGPQTEDQCLAAIYTRTDSHAEMIIAAGIKAAEEGGYEAPEWAKPLSKPGDDSAAEPSVECEGDLCTDTSATEPGPTVIKKTTTTGCSAAPGTAPRSAFAAFGLAAVALVFARRRRAR